MSRPIQPWQTLEARIVYDGAPFLRVRQETCQLPHGPIIPDYHIVEQRDVVLVVAITPQQEVLMVEQYKHGIGDICLELPGGVMDGSDPIREATRELIEETGYTTSPLEPLLTLIHDPTRANNRVYTFLGQNAVPQSEPDLDSTEAIRLRHLPLNEIIPAINSGRILASHSIAALYAALLRLGCLRIE